MNAVGIDVSKGKALLPYAVVEQYNRDLAEWERSVRKNGNQRKRTTQTARKGAREEQAQAVAGTRQTAECTQKIL